MGPLPRNETPGSFEKSVRTSSRHPPPCPGVRLGESGILGVDVPLLWEVEVWRPRLPLKSGRDSNPLPNSTGTLDLPLPFLQVEGPGELSSPSESPRT